MRRENEIEILDRDDTPDDLIRRGYEDLAKIHRWLGDTANVIHAIRSDPLPVRRVLEIGCATGLVLQQIGRELGVEVMGVDINPHPTIAAPVPIVRADAVRASLPAADVAFCMHVGHHLSEDELLDLISNVGRHCRRFIILDLVRHPLPLSLFRLFVAPFVSAINAEDGQRSIRKAYTADELWSITNFALAGTGSTFKVKLAPLYIRQVVDICYSRESRQSPVLRESLAAGKHLPWANPAAQNLLENSEVKRM